MYTIVVFLLSAVFFAAQATVNIDNGCALGVWTNSENAANYEIPQPTWLQTPSIAEISTGHYRALGRVIHANYLKEQLQKQKGFNFEPTRKTMELVQRLDILADTLYIEGVVVLRGIRNVKIYAREIVASTGSRLEISSPNWNQEYTSPVSAGHSGDDGNHGVHGPRVDVFCDVINGAFEVFSNAGNGHKGQDGTQGATARDSGHIARCLPCTPLLCFYCPPYFSRPKPQLT